MIRFHAISRLEGGNLDGIHLLWSPPFPAGYSLDGFTIYRRPARGEKGMSCIDLSAQTLAEARNRGLVVTTGFRLWADAADPADLKNTLWTYRVELSNQYSMVTVTAPAARASFVGTPDGTVTAGAAFTAPAVTLHGSGIGIVWVVTDDAKQEIRICGDVPDERRWAGVDPLVKNLQVPFETVNPDVGSAADGLALAEARALPETLSGDFSEVSRYANAALARPVGAPAWSVISEKPGAGGNAWDVSPYGLAMATTVLAPWRRGWGFAHLDTHGLVQGQSYDYRIVGTVRRRDRDERMYDLHTVPRGYRLPQCFRWGSAVMWCDGSPVVRELVTSPGDPSTIRKGFETARLIVRLDMPTTRFVLDLVPGGTVDAKAYRYGALVGSASAAASERTEFDFGALADLVIVVGSLGVAGIVPVPLAAALNPDEPVPVTQTIYDVRYGNTPTPQAPESIDVISLSDPTRTAARSVQDTNRGFAIDWPAPSSVEPTAVPYLPRSAAAPPTDVAYYILERSLHGGAFEPAAGDGVHASGRNAPTGTEPAAFGFDLMRAFPSADTAPSSHNMLVHASEIFEPGQVEYGATVVYRVSSVDATGRRSAPRVSASAALRKFIRPPAPTTPPAAGSADPEAVPEAGVEVRLLQADDPDLTAEQRALADGADRVVIRWGWGPEQRDLDPDVTEFRIYRHDSALTALDVRPAGVSAAAGTGWTLPVRISRPVAANEFAGVPVVLGHAYRITGHGGGTSVVLSLAGSPVDPARAPSPQPFVMNRTTSAELNPEYWDDRVMVVPRTPAPPGSDLVEGYRVVLEAPALGVDAAHPRRQLAYGVTAADSESYVPDRRADLEPVPRPGNESTVAGVESTARYFGRPTLTLVDLADVSAVTAPRQAGDDVRVRIRLADFLPPGFVAAPLMLLDRLPASAPLTRLRVEPGSITLIAADGTARLWTLAPADEAALRAGYEAGLVPDRFLAHAATRLDGLDDDAVRLGPADPSALYEDTVPNRPARWLYRLRAVDSAGRPSAAAQVLAVVVRVPSIARAVAPQLERLDVTGGTATVRLDCRRSAGDCYVFLTADESFRAPAASLSTIRNRPDLPPIDRLVVRDTAGRRLVPAPAVPATDGFAVVSVPAPAGGFVFHAWAIAVSADGVPSRLAGPVHTGALPTGV